MSDIEENPDDVAVLRQALAMARGEVKAVRQEMAEAVARQEDVQRRHEEALAEVRRESSQEVVLAALRAEAMRLGAHNPEDVVRLMDVEGVSRADDGTVVGVGEALERVRQERAYLFGGVVASGVASGTTVGHAAPKPGVAAPFDARAASEADYEARKWQFLARG